MMEGRRAGASLAAWRARAGLGLLLALLLPPSRHALEASMTAHMLVQYVAVLVAGGLMADALPARWLHRMQRWNELGIAGLAGSALTLAVLMVPRVLDLALVDMRVESLKLAALVLSGAALKVSWRRAGPVVQVFFLGNVLAMTAVVGILYQDPGTRVCNAYLLDDQQNLGVALVWIAIGVAALWLASSGLRASHRDESPAPGPF